MRLDQHSPKQVLKKKQWYRGGQEAPLSEKCKNSRKCCVKPTCLTMIKNRMTVRDSDRMSLGALCPQDGSRKSQGVFARGCVVSCRHSPSNTTVSTGVFAHINTTPLGTNSPRKRARCSMPFTPPFLDQKQISWPASSTRMFCRRLPHGNRAHRTSHVAVSILDTIHLHPAFNWPRKGREHCSPKSYAVTDDI